VLPTKPTTNDYAKEVLLCSESLAYFAHNYGHVQQGSGEWLPFHLWNSQIGVCDDLDDNRFAAILKARQLGLSWIAVHEVLATMLFKPGSKSGVFSLRENEAKDLLGRIKSVYALLPQWMKPAKGVLVDAATEFQIGHGSRALAFSTNSGDSYTFDLVIVDEADLVVDLERMLRSVKPTIDAGGRIRLISRSNKKLPVSIFKKIYQAGRKGLNSYKAIFLPWSAHPGRTQEWYDREKSDSIVNTGSLDYLYEQYPSTPEEAMSADSKHKRIPTEWLSQCYLEMDGLVNHYGPSINGFTVYFEPVRGRRYVIGIDTSEGNPTSDESSLTVGDLVSGEEVATLNGLFEPAVLASHAIEIAKWYNNAPCLPERNNHGHALILEMRNESNVKILNAPDGKMGWISTAKGNALLYSNCADTFRNKQTTMHSFETYSQLSSIEGSTLAAPKDAHDDRADSYALMLQAAVISAGHSWIAPQPINQQEVKQQLPGHKPKSQDRNPFLVAKRPTNLFGNR